MSFCGWFSGEQYRDHFDKVMRACVALQSQTGSTWTLAGRREPTCAHNVAMSCSTVAPSMSTPPPGLPSQTSSAQTLSPDGKSRPLPSRSTVASVAMDLDMSFLGMDPRRGSRASEYSLPR